MMLYLCGCSANKKDDNVSDEEDETVVIDEAKEEDLPILFDGDSEVNEILVSYNNTNPDKQIAYGDFVIYNHHGSNHTNQGISENHNGFEVVISTISNSYIYIFIQWKQSGLINDDYKAEAFKWIKALYPNASDEDINSAWEEAETTSTHSKTIKNEIFARMDLDITENNGKIVDLKITKYNS